MSVVYSTSFEALNLKEVQKILLDSNIIDGISNLPPAKPKAGEIFLFCPRDVDCKDDWRCDQYRWKNGGVHKLPKTDPVIRKSYFRIDTPDGTLADFQKHAYQLLCTESVPEMIGHRTLIHYLGNESVAVEFPHGNSKHHDRNYVSTCQSVLKQIENRSTADVPSKVYKSEVQKKVPFTHMPVLLPRNTKQIENIRCSQLKKFRLSHDALYNLHEIAINIPNFVHKITTYPDLLCIFGLKDVLDEFDKVLLLKSPSPQILSYDTTFQLGDFYLSVLSFRHTLFKEVPTIPAAFMLHERKFADHHTDMLATCCKLIRSLKKVTSPIVTDEEKAIINAISATLPEAHQLRCWNHLFRDITRWLRSHGAPSQDIAIYINDVKTLFHSSTENEYRSLLEEMKGKWSCSFVTYYLSNIEPDIHSIGRWVIAPHGIYNPYSGVTNNQAEALNFVIKQLQEWRESPVDCMILSLYYLQSYYMKEIARGQMELGNYHVHSVFSAITSTQTQFFHDELCHSYEDIVCRVKGEVAARTYENVDCATESTVKNETTSNLSRKERAQRLIVEKKISIDPNLHTFTILGTGDIPHVVKLFPFESCSCPSSTKDCYHILAAKMSVGMEEENNKKTKVNLTQLRKNARSRKEKKSGRKKPRVGDLEVLPAPDAPLCNINKCTENNVMKQHDGMQEDDIVGSEEVNNYAFGDENEEILDDYIINIEEEGTQSDCTRDDNNVIVNKKSDDNNFDNEEEGTQEDYAIGDENEEILDDYVINIEEEGTQSDCTRDNDVIMNKKSDDSNFDNEEKGTQEDYATGDENEEILDDYIINIEEEGTQSDCTRDDNNVIVNKKSDDNNFDNEEEGTQEDYAIGDENEEILDDYVINIEEEGTQSDCTRDDDVIMNKKSDDSNFDNEEKGTQEDYATGDENEEILDDYIINIEEQETRSDCTRDDNKVIMNKKEEKRDCDTVINEKDRPQFDVINAKVEEGVSTVPIPTNKKESAPKLISRNITNGTKQTHVPSTTNRVTQESSSRRKRCRTCSGCMEKDCGKCKYCLDKPKNGGKGTLRQTCVERKCKALESGQKDSKRSKQFGYVVSTSQAVVSVQDLRRIYSGQWLSDSLINHILYYWTSSSKNKKLRTLPSQLFAKVTLGNVSNINQYLKGDLQEYDGILLPCCYLNHWTLAVIRPQKNIISIFDSATLHSHEVRMKISIIIEYCKKNNLLKGDFHFVNENALQQQNKVDCGVLLCKVAFWIINADYYNNTTNFKTLKISSRQLREWLMDEFIESTNCQKGVRRDVLEIVLSEIKEIHAWDLCDNQTTILKAKERKISHLDFDEFRSQLNEIKPSLSKFFKEDKDNIVTTYITSYRFRNTMKGSCFRGALHFFDVDQVYLLISDLEQLVKEEMPQLSPTVQFGCAVDILFPEGFKRAIMLMHKLTYNEASAVFSE